MNVNPHLQYATEVRIDFQIFQNSSHTNEGLPGVLGEQGNTVDSVVGDTGTKQENHREQGNTKYIGEQGNKAYFRERI